MQEGGRIAHESIGQRNIFQQRRDVAGRSGVNRFGKQQRTGGRGVFQDFIKEPAGVMHAAGLEADDNAELPASAVRFARNPATASSAAATT